jgi:flagellar biogenesis protein FliO
MSDTFSITQLIIITAFLSVLIGVMFVVRRYKEPLSKQLGGQRRIKLMEDTSIGANERAKLIEVDGQVFLIISAKNQPPSVMPFDPTTAAFAHNGQGGHGNQSGRVVQPSAQTKPASPQKSQQPRSQQATKNTPFMEAMKQARLRNPNLGLDQS